MKNSIGLILISALLAPLSSFAEDIDLFQGGVSVAGDKPNVLMIVDNSANWNANNQGWLPSGTKQGEAELNAMNTVFGTLTGDVRVGMMMFTEGTGGENPGGYMRFAIRDMDSTNRPAIQSILTGIKPNFSSSTEEVGTSFSVYDNLMYEAFRYFSGEDRYAKQDSKRDYTGNGAYNISPYTAGNLANNAMSNSTTNTYNAPLSADANCAKNFIIFIGNGYPNHAGSDPTTLPGVTNFNTNQIYVTSPATQFRYADEWARYLKQVGAVAPCKTVNGKQQCASGIVTTYTIDVYKDQQDLNETALLKSMASAGGGKYFAATSEQEIKDALTTIFNEVQAVNSVFASATLPVSVNTQGTFKNQVYIGVFRPDGDGKPRWPGNLKEYKFGLTTDATGADEIYLATADDTTPSGNKIVKAVDPNSGFITSDARSYWTSSTSPSAGFWAFNPTGVGGQYDSPDGDLVEKGGAGQKLRTQFVSGSGNNRTVYTCTPNCSANTTPSLFATSNATLTTALSSPSTNVTLARTGATVTGTTTANLGLATPTDTVTISGSSVAAYNSIPWTATPGAGNTFTFTISETPVTPATGTSMTVAAGSSVTQSVLSNQLTFSSATGRATVHLTAHGFINNQSITIGGVTGTAYDTVLNGTFPITVIDTDNFYYTPTPGTSTTVTETAGTYPRTTTNYNCSGTAYGAASMYLGASPNTVIQIITASNSTNGSRTCGVIGNTLNLTSPPATFSGSYSIVACPASFPAGYPTNVGNSTFCVTAHTTTSQVFPTSPAAGSVTATGVPTRAITSITRTAGNASNVATVTVTTATNHGFTSGSVSSVTVAGADQTDYNGVKTSTNALAFPTANTITYTLTTGPTTPATGGQAAKGSGIPAATLINWVRGVDNKDDENNNNSFTDVRASIHGDVLHARPAVVNYGDSLGIMVYYGANDGTYHAVQGGDESVASNGNEHWSFVAPEHYSTLGRLYYNSPVVKFPNTSTSITPTPSKRNYYFDGNTGIYQSADLATTHIIPSMRRGGRALYAFDVSKPFDASASLAAPKFLWEFSNSNNAELGQTWSEPKVFRLRKTAGTACLGSDETTFTRAVVFGAGYDTTEEDKDNQGNPGIVRSPTMGRGVFIINEADGSLIKLLQPTDTKKYSFPADVTLLDTDGDGCIDRLYAVDTGANIWRFDIGDANNTNWKTYKIATLGDVANDGGPDDRKFMSAPEVVFSYVNGSPAYYLLVGSGNRETPQATTVSDKFFMVKDSIAAGTDPTSTTVTDNYPKTIGGTSAYSLTNITVFDATTTTVDASLSSFNGWYVDFASGEKSVNAPLAVQGIVYFGTNLPKTVDPNDRSCSANLGTARGYAVNVFNGTAAYDRNQDGSYTQADLYTTFANGGLPPSPVTGVVQIGDKDIRFVIGAGGTGVGGDGTISGGSSGGGSGGSPIDPLKVPTIPSSSRTKVFWEFQKD